MKKIIAFCMLVCSFSACNELNQVVKNIPSVETGSTVPTNFEISQGLKAALEKGTLNGVMDLAESGGYFNNSSYRIHFPENAKKVEKTLRDLGFDEEVDRLVLSLNRAAENAVTEAKPIFISAIKNMGFGDVQDILFGADTAATAYLKRTTSTELHQKFEPHIKQSLEQVNATKYWTEIMTQYNKIPLVEKVNTNLADYVTNKAIHALFLEIAEEEEAIREEPQKRTTELLKKVFSYAESEER